MPPLPQTFRVNVDGSFLPDLGNIGSDGIIRDCSCNWLSSFRAYNGIGDVVKAEILGLVHGFHLA